MARCYHDRQDFKSDVNIEVAKECDLLEAGQDLKDIKCTKNPGHRDFIPFKDLTLKHLPIEVKKTETLDSIKKKGSTVVRLVVDKKRHGKVIREVGSGCVSKFNNNYFIETNNHVVKTDDEVKHCIVEFHYDDEDRSNVLTSRGMELVKTCPYRDFTVFTFHPVPYFLHQLEFMFIKRPTIVIMYKNTAIETVLAFFRPVLSKLQFNSELNLNSLLIDFMFMSCPEGSISYLKSCNFKFQPIPSYRPLFTAIKILFCYSISSINIEIHIDEDDGKSRVIPGVVVKFDHDYVVKISESIFQDQVKKYRLVWNGEVIGCGTRLYFQQVKASDIYSGIDLEQDIEKLEINNLWIFDCYPMPREFEDMLHRRPTKYMSCIGHPHGGIKMVTFGQALGVSLQRFDNQHRHITQPNPDCQCKEVNCAKYSCKTCPGSSGSPVFPLAGEKMNLSSRHVHFMGERIKGVLPNGELVENVNIAWSSTEYS